MLALATLRSALPGAVLETVAAGQAAARYASGFRGQTVTNVPRWLCTPEAARSYPVLLVHGIFHNQSWSARLERTLVEHGYLTWSINYRTVGATVDHAAGEVAHCIRTLCAQHDVDRVHVVGHSLGGLVLRAAVAAHGAGDGVAAAVTLGTPHQGSPLAAGPLRRLPVVGNLVDQVAPGSPYLAALAAREPGSGAAAWTAIYSRGDEVVPGEYGRLDHPALAARNVEIPHCGHLSLMYDSRAAAAVLAALAMAEPA